MNWALVDVDDTLQAAGLVGKYLIYLVITVK